jgi:aminoglycoside phosphotransferase (APT) family kinase protein
MKLGIPLDLLTAYAHRQLGITGNPAGLRVEPLAGGYVAAGVYRLELRFNDPQPRLCAFVQKYTQPAEVGVMQALHERVQSDAVPQLVASYMDNVDPENTWFITPHYPGKTLSWEDEMPDGILRMLAQVHVIFMGLASSLPDVHQVDALFFCRTIAQADAALDSMRATLPAEIYYEVEQALTHTHANKQLEQALSMLPLTLAHGDVHFGNMIRGEDGRAVLIDWGNACRAPAMLDLANVVDFNSPAWETYLGAWEKAAGHPLDLLLAEVGYCWATVQINMQYLPFALEHMDSGWVLEMARKALAAQARLAELLGLSKEDG